MKYRHLFFLAWIVVLLSACASHQTITDAKSKYTPVTKVSSIPKVSLVKESIPAKELLKQETPLVSRDIVGTPLPGGKFAKLKIGLSMQQVEELIGTPDRQWQQATGEETTPYYTGTDRWLIQRTYKSEGMLSFTVSPEHILIRILVNRAE